MARKLRYIGTHPVVLDSTGVDPQNGIQKNFQPGDDFETENEVLAADLARRPDWKEVVAERPRPRREE